MSLSQTFGITSPQLYYAPLDIDSALEVCALNLTRGSRSGKPRFVISREIDDARPITVVVPL